MWNAGASMGCCCSGDEEVLCPPEAQAPSEWMAVASPFGSDLAEPTKEAGGIAMAFRRGQPEVVAEHPEESRKSAPPLAATALGHVSRQSNEAKLQSHSGQLDEAQYEPGMRRHRSSGSSNTSFRSSASRPQLRPSGSFIKESISCLSSLSEDEWAVAYPKVAKLVSFHGNKALLRASPLSLVMQGNAAILAESKGSAATYALSEEVRDIAAFISHNWVVPRVKKFICLAMHFNFCNALLAAAVVIVMVFTLTGMGIFPLMSGTEDGLFGTLLPAPAFFLVVLFGHRLQGLVGCCVRSPRVFLDKTCIHQVDQHLQKQGILKLGAFIKHSSRMLVIYTDVYLTKLWTVYEVACFLALHPTSKMTVIPTYLPVLTLAGTFIAWSIHLFELVTKNVLKCSDCSTILIFYFLGAFPFAAVLRSWARTKADIGQRLDNFKVEDCLCFSESDRRLVYESIHLLMQATMVVGDDATEEEARDAFNRVLRKTLPGALTTSVGRFGLSYLQALQIFLCTNLPQALDTLWRRPGIRTRAVYFFYFLTWNFALIPLGVAFLAWWCGLCLSFRGCKEWAFVGSGCCLMMAMQVMFFIVMQTVLRGCSGQSHGDAYLACLLFILSSTTMLAVAVFNLQLPGGSAGTEASAEEQEEEEEEEGCN